jgi:hypothetical protein
MLKNKLLILKPFTKLRNYYVSLNKIYILNYRAVSNINKINSKYFSTQNEKISSKTKVTQIYEYTNAENKARAFFWLNMLYIYGNSFLLHLDIFDPAMGYFHGVMLTLSVTMGWAVLLLMGNVIQKTVYKIHRIEEYNKKPVYKIEYISYFKKSSFDIFTKTDVVDYTQSNIENFHFFRLRNKNYKKIYVNTHKNLYEYEPEIQREFKNLVSTGLEN